MTINWNMVAALAAVIGAGAIVWQTYRTTRVQVLMQLLADWQSPRMEKTRSYAAGAILSGKSSQYIDDVLDFLKPLRCSASKTS